MRLSHTLFAAALLAAAPALAQTPTQTPTQTPAQAPAKPPSPSAATASGPAYITESRFGIFTGDKAKPSFKETDAVPRQTGQQYGWVLKLSTDLTVVHVREVIHTPAPADWSGGGKLPPGMTVAADKRSAVFERDMPVRQGLIFTVWSVGAADPPGDYEIGVTINGQLRQFNFTVE